MHAGGLWGDVQAKQLCSRKGHGTSTLRAGTVHNLQLCLDLASDRVCFAHPWRWDPSRRRGLIATRGSDRRPEGERRRFRALSQARPSRTPRSDAPSPRLPGERAARGPGCLPPAAARSPGTLDAVEFTQGVMKARGAAKAKDAVAPTLGETWLVRVRGSVKLM